MRSLFLGLLPLCLMLSTPALAQVDVEYDEEKPHHLSVIVGGSYIDEIDETEFILGIDY